MHGQLGSHAATAVPATGGTLLATGGGACLIKAATVLLHSNTTLRCERTAYLGIDLAPAVATVSLFKNVNWQAAAVTDRNITVRDCSFVWKKWWRGNPAKSLEFWHVDNVRVINNHFSAGGNATAMIGSTHTNTEGNFVFGVTNACFDYWAGGGWHRIVNNFCHAAANSTLNSFAIQLSAADFAGKAAMDINDVVIAGNTLMKDGDFWAAIGTNGTGAVNNLTVEGNHIYLTGSGGVFSTTATAASGIMIADKGVTRKTIANNTITGAGLWPSIWLYSGSDVRVVNNTLYNCAYASGTYGNSIAPNTAYTFTGNIQLVPGTRTTVTGNRSRNCSGTLISADTSPADTIGANGDGSGMPGSPAPVPTANTGTGLGGQIRRHAGH